MLPSINQQLDLKQEQLKQKEKLKKQPEPFTSAFFTDQTREKQLIEEAFSANNYTTIRNLPDIIQHQSILENQKDRVEEMYFQQRKPKQLTGPVYQKQPVVKLSGGGYFTAFEYTPIDYEHIRQQKVQERLQNENRMKVISTDQFVPVKNIKKMKFEDPFNFTEEKKEYLFPFHIPEDYYDLNRENDLRQRVVEEAKIIAGSFLPPGKKRPYCKSDFEDIMRILKDIIASDWPTAQVLLGTTSEETIEVVFLISSITHSLGLLTAYMNSLINDERVAHYQLSRVIDQWEGHQESVRKYTSIHDQTSLGSFKEQCLTSSCQKLLE